MVTYVRFTPKRPRPCSTHQVETVGRRPRGGDRLGTNHTSSRALCTEFLEVTSSIPIAGGLSSIQRPWKQQWMKLHCSYITQTRAAALLKSRYLVVLVKYLRSPRTWYFPFVIFFPRFFVLLCSQAVVYFLSFFFFPACFFSSVGHSPAGWGHERLFLLVFAFNFFSFSFSFSICLLCSCFLFDCFFSFLYFIDCVCRACRI